MKDRILNSLIESCKRRHMPPPVKIVGDKPKAVPTKKKKKRVQPKQKYIKRWIPVSLPKEIDWEKLNSFSTGKPVKRRNTLTKKDKEILSTISFYEVKAK